jgi:GAF domain-containing protein
LVFTLVRFSLYNSDLKNTMQNSFGKEIIPENDEERVKALHKYKFLDNLPEKYFTSLARIIATTFNAPIALVSFVDHASVTFPGNFGMENTSEVERGSSLCSLAILDKNPTVFKDALKEPCLLANPLVTGQFGLKFYAGAPIITKDGFAIGTVCIVGKEPRNFSKEEETMLHDFAQSAMNELDIRRQLLE